MKIEIEKDDLDRLLDYIDDILFTQWDRNYIEGVSYEDGKRMMSPKIWDLMKKLQAL